MEPRTAFWSVDETAELGPAMNYLSDGTVEVDVRHRLQVPAARANWSEEALEPAFVGLIAIPWMGLPGKFQIGLRLQMITKADFARFCDLNGFARPNFWCGASEGRPLPTMIAAAVKRFQRWFAEQSKGAQLYSKGNYRGCAVGPGGVPWLSTNRFDEEKIYPHLTLGRRAAAEQDCSAY